MLLKKEEVVKVFQNITETEKTKRRKRQKKYISQCNFKKVYNFIYSNIYGINGKYGIQYVSI